MEVPRNARVQANSAIEAMLEGLGRHIDASLLVPDLVTDIVYGAVERADARNLAQEVMEVCQGPTC